MAVIDALRAISATEWAAVVFAIAYLLLAMRQDRRCWIAAAGSSALFLVIFLRSGLPMQAALQVFYIAASVYGWFAWQPGEGKAPLQVTRWPLARHAIAAVAILALAAATGRYLSTAEGAVVPYVDAFVAWGSMLATWLAARKVLENWLYWIVMDLTASSLYFTQGLHATGVLFLLYVMLAIKAWFEWRADLVKSDGAAR